MHLPKRKPNPNPDPKPTSNPRLTGPARIILPAAMVVAACTGATPTATPSPTVTPPAPTTVPTAAPAVSHIAITIASGNDVTIAISDASGLVRDASAGTPGDGASVAPSTLAVANDDPTTLRLTWTGGPCDADARLDVGSAARTLRVTEPACDGDAVAFDRVLVLHLTDAVDAESIEADLDQPRR